MYVKNTPEPKQKHKANMDIHLYGTNIYITVGMLKKFLKY